MEQGKVVKGEYQGKKVLLSGFATKHAFISASILKPINLDSSTVARAVVMDETKQDGKIRHSLIFPTSKVKNNDTATIGVEFKDGKKCIIECSAQVKAAIVRDCASLDF